MSAPGGIPAIETRAYGCRFRSRLEARWAVFLTEAGFDWEYEPEGAALASGNYLCDFRVTGPNGVQVWLEVKPKLADGDQPDDPRWLELARSSGLMLFTVRGMHRVGDRCDTAHSCRVWLADGTVADVHRLWQGEAYAAAWNRASEARFDGRDGLKHRPGRGPRRKRRGRG
jgi:hypothetical protein